jgi:nucleoside-diphosphate-sugar epimerase
MVGNCIARALISEAREVRALVRSPDMARALLPAGVDIVRGDVTDAESLRRAAEGCSAVYHCAGLPEQWLADDATFDRVNVGGTKNAIEAALHYRVELHRGRRGPARERQTCKQGSRAKRACTE